MSTRFHGITSVLWVGAAIVIAGVQMAGASVGLLAGYGVVCLAGMLAIFYAYCAKCPCKACCAHVLPGKVAGLFPRKPGPYSGLEQATVVIVLLIILGIPHPWLWGHWGAFAAFWILTAIGAAQILTFICRSCPNTHCPVGKMRRS